LQERANRHDLAPTWDTKLELQNAIIQLEVKKTLMNNFKGTESLQSEAVRSKLLQTLNKSIITISDLADLQSLVQNEKARLQAERMQSQPQVQPQPQTQLQPQMQLHPE
jgi:hypothetical protein